MLSGQIKAQVAHNLDAEMVRADISAAELARRLGLNEKTVRRWRTGEVMPGIERLAEVAAELGCETLSFYRETEAAA